jgi:hypothetical protein
MTMYGYRFTSTLEDLLEAEEAERSHFLRRPFRGAIIVLGWVWLAAGFATFLRQPTLQPLVWTCLGAGVVYYFVVRTHRRRSRITTNTAARQDVTLEFADDGLNVGIGDVGQFARQWNELAGITNTDKGILFYFADGAKNWLPKRVFRSEVERRNLLEFLTGRQTARQAKAGDAGHTEA